MTTATLLSKKSIASCVIGNMIEWYDFGLFAYFAPVISKLFFPHNNTFISLIQVFLVFAAAYLVRPIGAILFGHLGDRWGRAKTLKISIILISIPTVGIGLMPTYHSIGVTATLLLIVLRLMQGLCIGGEFAGSMTYLSEMAAANRRAYISSYANSLSNFGVVIGVALMALIVAIIPHAQFMQWGWRVPFVLGGVLGLIGLWLRGNLQETGVFIEIKNQQTRSQLPIKDVLKKYPKKVLQIIFLLFMGASSIYTLLVYLTTYFHVILQVPLSKALFIQMIYLVISASLMPVFGKVADRYGRRIVLITAAIAFIVLTWPSFYALNHLSIWLSSILILPLMVFIAMGQGATPAMMVEHFPANIRYTGISFSYNVCFSLIGGFAPAINMWMIHATHNPLMPAMYVTVGALVTLLVTVFVMKRSYGEQVSLSSIQ